MIYLFTHSNVFIWYLILREKSFQWSELMSHVFQVILIFCFCRHFFVHMNIIFKFFLEHFGFKQGFNSSKAENILFPIEPQKYHPFYFTKFCDHDENDFIMLFCFCA